ncbi:MAG: hypothetical protein IPM54_37535 [Polyangiaceae bacterium]|nr:hypothetical protein [Polyangiaceae bacterium]
MFDLPCNWRAGFVMDPTKKQRFGYITSLDGFGLSAALPTDITVYTPYNTGAAPTYAGISSGYTAPSEDAPVGVCKVVGVLEHFSWGGGVGDPISVSMYVSQENATQIKALQQLTLKTTTIKKLGWWIANYDEEVKKWFEEAFPKAPQEITGQINAPGKNDIRLHVASDPEKVAPNIDVNVYNVNIEIVPAANKQHTLHFANSDQKKVVKAWGLVVGTMATQSVG